MACRPSGCEPERRLNTTDDEQTTVDAARSNETGLGLAVAAQISVFVVTTLVLGLLLLATSHSKSMYNGQKPLEPMPFWATLVGIVAAWPVLFAAARLVSKRRQEPLLPMPLIRLNDTPWLLLGAAGQFAVGAISGPITKLFGEDPKAMSKRAKDLFDPNASKPLLVLLAIAVAVGAPIVEELFYRGLIYRGMVRYYRGSSGKRSVVFPIVFSGMVFGAIHLSPIEFIPLSLVGMACAFALHRTKRLTPAMFFHMGFNLVSVLVLMANVFYP